MVLVIDRAQEPEVLARWGSYGNWRVRLKRYPSHPRDGGCYWPGFANASSVFIRRMTPAFKQFQPIFLVRKAQFFCLASPSGARFGVRRRECSFPGLRPAPFLEPHIFKNVGSIVVPEPIGQGDHDAQSPQLVLTLFTVASAPDSRGLLQFRAGFATMCAGKGARG